MKFNLKHFLCPIWLALAVALLPGLRAQESAPLVAQSAIEKESSPAIENATGSTESAPNASVGETDEADSPPTPPVPPAKKAKKRPNQPGVSTTTKRNAHNSLVGIGHSVSLGADKQVQSVVSIFGTANSAGEVSDAVVSVLGGSRVTGGSVGDSVVAVLGDVYVNGHVRGAVVAVLGNVDLGPEAIIDGEIVCIGGKLTRDAKATSHGEVQNIAFGGEHFDFGGLQAWFTECVLKVRLLAFDMNVLWAWGVALVFLLVYTFIGLLAADGVRHCTQTLEDYPGKSILTGVLALVLTPVAYLLLVITLFIGIGFALIPLFTFGLFLTGIFGKIVMLAWFGRRLTRAGTGDVLGHPAVTVLIGGSVVLLLYTIPVFGFILYKLLGLLGLGVVLYTLILSFNNRKSRTVPVAPLVVPAGFTSGAAEVPLAGPKFPPVISAATLPRAGFWLRFAASLIDVILVGIVSGILHWIGGGFPLWLAIYCVAMWATKGTTVGGIICGLRLVRLDDRPVDWSVAVVRGLGAFLSLAVAGLGFVWVAFDDEKQSWHDKIAGTTIVIVPKGTSLL